MTNYQEKIHIQTGDHTSRRVKINGYSVVLRFAEEPSTEIYSQIKNIFLSSIALACSEEVCNDCAEKTEEREAI